MAAHRRRFITPLAKTREIDKNKDTHRLTEWSIQSVGGDRQMRLQWFRQRWESNSVSCSSWSSPLLERSPAKEWRESFRAKIPDDSNMTSSRWLMQTFLDSESKFTLMMMTRMSGLLMLLTRCPMPMMSSPFLRILLTNSIGCWLAS